jgi:hypothetical protein
MAHKISHKQEDANPAAASSDEFDNEPQSAQPSPQPLSQPKSFREATCLGAWDRFGEWVKVAELVMVMVPGSVEDERMFSTLKYICNPQRIRLHAQQLMCCARGLNSSAVSMESIPYPRTNLEWLRAKKRRGIK